MCEDAVCDTFPYLVKRYNNPIDLFSLLGVPFLRGMVGISGASLNVTFRDVPKGLTQVITRS